VFWVILLFLCLGQHGASQGEAAGTRPFPAVGGEAGGCVAGVRPRAEGLGGCSRGR